MTSAVLLQRFLTGLCPEIDRQLLLKNKPANFTDALKDAIDIKHALQFDSSDDIIHAIGCGSRKTTQSSDIAPLHQTLETFTKRLESLEATMQKIQKPRPHPAHQGITKAMAEANRDIAEIICIRWARVTIADRLVTCTETVL